MIQLKKNAKAKSKAARKYIKEKHISQSKISKERKERGTAVKYSDILETVKHIPDNVVQNADVYLKINIDDLATLLSELLNNAYESEDGISIVPLKVNVQNSKNIPINRRISLEIDETEWKNR